MNGRARGRVSRAAALALVVVSLGTRAARADDVELASGEVVSGRVLEETAAEVRIETAGGIVALPRSDIVKIVRTTAPGLAPEPAATAPAVLPSASAAPSAPAGASPTAAPEVGGAAAVRALAASPGTAAERAARIRALGPAAMATLLTDPALGALADELAEPLFAGMSDADLRQAALAWLRMGRRLFEALLPRLLALPRDALVEPLLRFAACGDDPSGEEAAKARARVEDLFAFHGIGAALPILADGSLDPRLRSAAAAALGRAGRTEAIAPLLGAAAAPERSVRIAAIAALGELDDGSGTQVATLARALEGDDRAERKAAAVALGRLGAAAGVEGLLPLLESDDPGLRADAHWALKEITGRPFGPEPATWRAYWAAERRRADEQLPLVLLELSSGEPALVVGAMREAAALTAGRDRVRVALRPLLAAEAPSVRAAACVALAELRDRSAVPRLVAMLDDPDAAVWEAAWRALRRITGKDLPPRAAAWRAR